MPDTNVYLIQATQHKVDSDQVEREELESIIQNVEIVTLFQPIFDLSTHEPFAYEALSRGPKDSALHMPDDLFGAAERCGKIADLDSICRIMAILNFKRLNLPGKLSVNICPTSLIDPSFADGPTMRAIRDSGLLKERVIFELTEQQSVDHEKLKEAALRYQNMGFSIALDDLGAGYSSLRLLAELKPDFIKIDKFFTKEVHKNEVAGDFIKLILDMSNRVDCRVIAEGIEDVDELQFLRQSGLVYGQGYLLGKPELQPNLVLPSYLISIGSAEIADVSMMSLNERERVNSLSPYPTQPCMYNDKILNMLTRFQKNSHLLSIPVLKEKKVIGVLLRDEILNTFSAQYAHSLFHNAITESMMQTDPLIVQMNDTLTHVSQLATKRTLSQVYCPLIVCDKETYIGTVSIQDLLKNITEIQLEHALHCNPLSGLPGNICIESEVQGRLTAKTSFALLHFDLDNFKAYNDFYGYERGDHMIILVADLLQKMSIEGDFVGHIGGDDFVMLLAGEAWETRIWEILDHFKESSQMLYDPSERDQKCIESTDRAGEIQMFDLASLSVSALQCFPGQFTSHLEASEVIAEIKHRSKKIRGNSLVVNRRAD